MRLNRYTHWRFIYLPVLGRAGFKLTRHSWLDKVEQKRFSLLQFTTKAETRSLITLTDIWSWHWTGNFWNRVTVRIKDFWLREMKVYANQKIQCDSQEVFRRLNRETEVNSILVSNFKPPNHQLAPTKQEKPTIFWFSLALTVQVRLNALNFGFTLPHSITNRNLD